jgi:hypothetical protein
VLADGGGAVFRGTSTSADVIAAKVSSVDRWIKHRFALVRIANVRENGVAALSSLLAHGVVGTYTQFEATEVFAVRNGQKEAINVFTILVAEERQGEVPQQLSYLTPKPFRLKKSLPDWMFGVARYVRPIADLVPALTAMAETGVLSASGKELRVGRLHEVAPQFVPPDSMTSVPWNKVLKNNFWSGSHVFEWSDREKQALQPFFDDSRLLQELSERVAECVPMTIAALSDRLANVAVQLPVTAMMTQHHGVRATGAFNIELAWAQNVSARPLRASCELEFDGIISGYASAPIQAPETTLSAQRGVGTHKIVIWDDLNQTVLAATGPAAFLSSIVLNMQAVGGEPRTFSIKQADGSLRSYQVGVSHKNRSVVGDQTADDTGGHTQKRLYKEQLEHLTASRVFVQYKPELGRQDVERERALEDLRMLIRRYGDEGAWLWDPYLTARDILETLFHCPHSGAELRALTGANEPPAAAATHGLVECIKNRLLGQRRPPRGKLDFVERQRAELDSTQSNWLGLRLEYRVRRGPAGFGFHDRFLIFPRVDEGALAWSLGTSVNSAGREHHILQQVDNGQLVRDAFIELWEKLDQPEHLIWRKP